MSEWQPIEQIIAFLDAWAEDQKVIAQVSRTLADRHRFMARAEALEDAVAQIKAGAYKEGLTAFLKMHAPNLEGNPHALLQE